MKNLTWQNPEQLFVAQELINKVKSKCCGIKVTVEPLALNRVEEILPMVKDDTPLTDSYSIEIELHSGQLPY